MGWGGGLKVADKKKEKEKTGWMAKEPSPSLGLIPTNSFLIFQITEARHCGYDEQNSAEPKATHWKESVLITAWGNPWPKSAL